MLTKTLRRLNETIIPLVAVCGLLAVATNPSAGQQPENTDGLAADAARSDAGAAVDIWSDVEKMVVTGGGAQGLIAIDEAMSATTFDSDELVKLGVSDIPSLAAFTPNLEIRTAGATAATFFIRGVGLNDFTANAAGSVGIYVDDVALNLPGFQSGQLFDVANVQVLKGPQGSGAGRNASAGAIKTHTTRPNGDFGGFLRADIGRFNSVAVEGAVSAPIWKDVFTSRLSFQVRMRDGLYKNRCGNQPAFNKNDPNDPINQARIQTTGGGSQSLCGEEIDQTDFVVPNPDAPPANLVLSQLPAGLETDLNDTYTWGARGQFRWRPSGEADWLLNLHTNRVDQYSTVGQPLGTSADFLGSAVGPGAGYDVPEIKVERDALVKAAIDATGFGDVPAFRCRESNNPECFNAVQGARKSAQSNLAKRLARRRPLDTKPFEGDINRPGKERQTVMGTFLRGEIDFAEFTLRTVSGFEHYDRERIVDADYTPNTYFEFDITDDAWQVTQDLLFGGELDSIPIVWSGGGYGLIEQLDYRQITLAGGDIQGLTQRYTQKAWGFGVWGEATWELLDDFEMRAGVRYNWERKLFDVASIRPAGAPTDRCDEDATRAIQCKDQRTYHAPTGVVALTYHFNQSASAYWKYTRGWKGAQFNVSTGATFDAFTEAKPETIDSIEFGFNGSWFNGILSVNGALFWYRYSDYQVFIFTNDFGSPPQQQVRNASDAQLYGAELEGRFEPIDGLVFVARSGWLESKFLDFSDSGVRRIVVSVNPPDVRTTEVPIDYTGNRLPNSPRFKVSGSVEYTIRLGSSGTLTPRYDFSYTDDVFFDPSGGRGAPNTLNEFVLPDLTIGQKGYVLHNARLTYTNPEETIEFSLWVRNISDEIYKTLAFDASETVGLVGNLVGDPRTYGAGLKLLF